MGGKHILKEKGILSSGVPWSMSRMGLLTFQALKWSSIGGIPRISVEGDTDPSWGEIGANLCPQVFPQLMIITMRIKTEMTKAICEKQQKQQIIDVNPYGLHILKLLNTDSTITPDEVLKEIMKNHKHEQETWGYKRPD